MKSYNLVLLAAAVLTFSGCVDSPSQHAEQPLPVGTSEQRAREAANETRLRDPALTRHQAASAGAADTLGTETQAEINWRKNQAAAADQEKFRKDLDAANGSK